MCNNRKLDAVTMLSVGLYLRNPWNHPVIGAGATDSGTGISAHFVKVVQKINSQDGIQILFDVVGAG